MLPLKDTERPSETGAVCGRATPSRRFFPGHFGYFRVSRRAYPPQPGSRFRQDLGNFRRFSECEHQPINLESVRTLIFGGFRMFSVLSASPARSPPSSLSVPTENGSGGVGWKRSLSGPRMSEPMPLSYVTSQEMRCLLHWLSDWSPVQREQFVHSLAEKAVPWKVLSLLDGLAGLSVESGKPPSIFECQMRLWDQWFRGWSQEERNEFVRQLEEAMPDVASRFYQEIAATAGQD